MTCIHLTNTDVVTVFNQNFGQSKCQAVHRVHIAFQEQNTTLLVRHWCAVRQLRCRAETVQDGFFVVVTWNAVLFRENTRPFIGTLIIDSIVALVMDRFNDTSKVRTAHWCGHDWTPLNGDDVSCVLVAADLHAHYHIRVSPCISCIGGEVDDSEITLA